jgi:hypothetical protein
MFNKVLKIIFLVFCAVSLFYLLLPNFDFPEPPPDSLQSQEPADTETPLRRAYFTNYTREEVMNWYKKELSYSNFLEISLPTYRLNYPPEDSQTIIRDQTRTTFLEEVVHPFRESVFINGFEPKDPKDTILIGGRNWRQKIIIRFVPSSFVVRIVTFAVTACFIIILFKAWSKTIRDIKKIKTRQ